MSANGSGHRGERVIVLGGGIAGLTAAVALAPRFERVLLVERDTFTEQPSVRRHVPQGHHVHILLARGLDEITKFVPELTQWLDELGLPEGDLTRDVHMNFGGTWLPRLASGIPLRPCTRPIMEHLLLRAARARPGIEILEGREAIELLGETGEAVTGVRLRDAEGEVEDLHADLVVAAGGRASHLRRWLEARGVGEVPEEVVDAKVAYASASFRPPADAELGDDWLIVVRSSRFPDEPQMAAIMRVSDEHWLTAMISYGAARSPKTVDDLKQALADRLGGEHGEALRRAEAISPIHHYANTANRRRYYGRASAWPERLVVLGDAVCALNPRYGQGMTVAALGVAALVDQLERHRGLDGLAPAFQRRLDKLLGIPWQMALMEDRLWQAQLEGRKLGALDGLMQRASQRLLETVFSDIDTNVRFMRVAHMIEAPTHLMRPGTLAKIVVPGLRQRGDAG